jgi:hypothetical protein
MPKIDIILAKEADAQRLKTFAMNAFEGDLKKYGHYPPRIESVE